MPDPESDPRTYAIIGAAMEVHKQLGCGFLEPVYQEAMALEMTRRGVPFQSQVELPVFYKGARLLTYYKADFVCFESIIVELKALAQTGGVEEAQVINYPQSDRFPRWLASELRLSLAPVQALRVRMKA